MAASNKFDNLLKQVQSSNLNFRIELSPFTAVITLKKSLIKDKTGKFLSPPTSESTQLQQANNDKICLIEKIVNLENVVKSLENYYENAVSECKTAYTTISTLHIITLHYT